MAITKEIEIIAKTDDANKDIQKVDDNLNNLDKSADKASKGVSSIGKSFKAVGTALKAAGIGLVIALFAKLTEIMSKNQTVMDAFSTVMTSVEIVFNDLFNFVSNNFMPAMESFKSFFENLTFDKFKKAIQENITERFNSLLEVLGFVGDAFKKLFDGDFQGALDSVKEAGKEMIDVYTGVDGTFDKVADSVTKYTKETIKQAKAITESSKAAQIGAAIQAKLVEQFDVAAEKQRQARDKDNESIEKRIEANDKLGKVLQEQEKAMIKQADLQVTAAENAFNLNKNDENRIALIDAQTNKIGVLAQVEGFRSEQIVNRIALEKEALDLETTSEEGRQERRVNQLAFDAERETNEAKRIEILKENIELETQIAEDKLARDREIYKEGTQARVDAEEEYLNKKQELDQRNATLNKEAETSDETLYGGKKKLLNDSLTLLSKASEESKAIQAGQALANTWQGVTEVWSAKSVLPEPIATAQKVASTGIVLASGLNAVKNIGASGGSVSTPTDTSAPSFNVVSGTASNQIADSVDGLNNRPVKTYVVGSEITTQQELDRNIDTESSI